MGADLLDMGAGAEMSTTHEWYSVISNGVIIGLLLTVLYNQRKK